MRPWKETLVCLRSWLCETLCIQRSCVVGCPWLDLLRTSDSSAAWCAFTSTALQLKGQLHTNGPKCDEPLYLANATKTWFNVSSLSKCFSSPFGIFGFNSCHFTVCGMFSMSFTLQQAFAAAINNRDVIVQCWRILVTLDRRAGCSRSGYAAPFAWSRLHRVLSLIQASCARVFWGGISEISVRKLKIVCNSVCFGFSWA